ERPTLCQEGGQSFIWSSDLVVYKHHHIDEKHYRCLECGKSFRQRSHQKIHAGEQPYNCGEHRKNFSRSSDLLSHQLLH
ncbi:ZN253 protein, partial [Chloropsis hardwickii]|nr:ZN253 protein [Chloropsis hardwickii]